jgi:hypothetical protein
MKIITFWLISIITCSTATAASILELDLVKETYNNNLDKIPGFVKRLIGTERINCYVTMNDGTEMKIGAVTKDSAIQELTDKEIGNATLKIYTSEKTILDISSSEKPANMLQEKLRNGEIRYEAIKFTSKAKLGFARFFMNVALFFQRIFP